MNQRAAPRVAISRMVLLCVGRQRIASATIDISLRGLGILTAVPRREGELVQVAWPLHSGKWGNADACVVRDARRTDGQHVIGLEFRHLDPSLRAELTEVALRLGVSESTTRLKAQHHTAGTTPLPSRLMAILPRNEEELRALYRLALDEVDQDEHELPAAQIMPGKGPHR